MSARRLVIAGLGNYTHPLTRHSVGQVLLKGLAARAASLPGSRGSPNLILDKKHPAWTTTITIEHPQGSQPPLEILFCLPRSLMNINGPAVVSCVNSFLQQPMNYRLVTLQDDLDLAPSTFKAQRGGGPRGHNGVRSVSQSLQQSRDFWRMRIGIGRPESRSEVARWVLSALGRAEVQAVEWDDGKGGVVLERVWEEIVKIGWSDEEDVSAQ